jgi:hypothetical protein
MWNDGLSWSFYGGCGKKQVISKVVLIDKISAGIGNPLNGLSTKEPTPLWGCQIHHD